MARVYTSGFESGTDWDRTNPTAPTIVTTQFRNGSHSLRCHSTSGVSSIAKTFTYSTSAHYFLRAYIYVASRPTARTAIMAWAADDRSTSGFFCIKMNTDGRLTAGSSGHGSGSTTSAVVPLNTWVRIEMEYNDADSGTGANTLKAYLDGTNWVTLTGQDLDGGDSARFGIVGNANASADIYFDSIAINDATGATDNGLPGAEPLDGTTYEDDLADSLGLTDNLSAVATGRSTLTDSVSLSDGLSTAATGRSTLTDSAGLTDALSTAALLTPLDQVDAVGLTDSLEITFLADPIEESDSIGLADSLSILHTLGQNLTDDIGLSDNFSTTVSGYANISDAMGLRDSVVIINPDELPIEVTLEDALAMTDTTAIAIARATAVSDTGGISDFITTILGYWEEDHMPHSNTGFGEIYIDRFFLVEKEKATEGNDGKLSLAGQESSPPTTVSLVTFLHGQISGMQDGKLVPVIFRDKAERNAYYSTGACNSDLTNYQGEVATADWTIELTRMGSAAEIDIQSRLTGAVRQNDFSLTGTRSHAPAIGHYAYFTGTTAPTAVTRSTSDGDIVMYWNIPENVHPKWGCAVEDYHTGRVRITDTLEVSIENEVEGLNRNISASGWAMSNGLMNITPTASAGVINVAYWNGTSFIDNFWKIQVGGSNVAKWDAATILRNDFEQCVMRLTASSAAGRVSLDLGLRRGSRLVEGYLQNSTSATLKVATNTTMASSSGGPGVMVANSGANRVAFGSAHTFVPDANGGLSHAATTNLDFWIGAVINASGTPGAGNTATDLRDAYLGSCPEYTYAVRR